MIDKSNIFVLNTYITNIHKIHANLLDAIKVTDGKASAIFAAYGLMTTISLKSTGEIANMIQNPHTTYLNRSILTLVSLANILFFLYTVIHAFLTVKARYVAGRNDIKNLRGMVWYEDILKKGPLDYQEEFLSMPLEDIVMEFVHEIFKLSEILDGKFKNLNKAYWGFFCGFFCWLILLGLCFYQNVI